MQASRKGLLVLLVAAMFVSGAYLNAQEGPVDQAQRQVLAYLSRLADLRCTEDVVQEKLAGNGHVEATAQSKYDYFLLMQGDGDGFQLNESRLELSNKSAKHFPMLLTNGFSTLLLVFHPYYRSSFTFEPGAVEMVNGRALLPVHFSHIPGTRTPAALALRGREYPLELQGTAWLDEQSGQVLRMDASLVQNMSDVGLRSMNVQVEYSPIRVTPESDTIMLPSKTVIDLETTKQRWRNTHIFLDYKSFSTDAVQDPKVNVHAKAVTDGEAETAPAKESN
jgi:hypothetical protein